MFNQISPRFNFPFELITRKPDVLSRKAFIILKKYLLAPLMAEEKPPTHPHKIFDSLAAAEQALSLGKPQKLWIMGQMEAICLVRTRAGIFAVADACPHLGDSLSKGTTNYLNEVVCPWHSYRFSLLTGQECEDRTKNLKTFLIEVQPDGVYLKL